LEEKKIVEGLIRCQGNLLSPHGKSSLAP